MRHRGPLAASVGAALLCCTTAFADAQEDFYRNKTISIVTGFKSGTTWLSTQIVARHLGRHMPGQPTGIAQQMPGGAHLVATNYVYNVAPADGLTLIAVNPQVAVAQLAKVPAVRFDIRKLEWIGSSGAEGVLLAIRADLPYRTFADLKSAPTPLIVGSTGPGSNSYDFPMLLKEFAGANFRLITGYSANPDVQLALQRREADVWTALATTVKLAAGNGIVRLMVRDRIPTPGAVHLPTDESLTTDPVGRSLMAIRAIPLSIGRGFGVRPGTPPERVAMLREALARAMVDPALHQEGKAAGLELAHIPADTVTRRFDELMTQPPEVLAAMGRYIKASD